LSANAAIVRELYTHWERGDFTPTDAFDPDVRLGWLDAITPGKDETVGLAESQAALGQWLDTFDGAVLTSEQIIDAGDKVAVIASWRGRGKASGAPTEWRHGQVFNFQHGKITSVATYPDPADALTAAGIQS
jgi:ketosteroid isomerase-like protein